jgi:hypothetical protein
MDTHMQNGYRLILVLVVLAGFWVVPAAADSTTDGGDQGWYVIHCNVYGSKVYLDDAYVGTTGGSTLTVPVSVSAPYKKIRVQKIGFSTFVNSITEVPGPGETVDLYATLNELPDTTQTVIGGDVGWYVVHCNIDGASVMFDATDKGEITQGMVYVPVYSTGTPYREYTVKKEGYKTFTATIPDVPGKGETIDLYATLNPVATTATTTPVLIGGDIGWYAVHCNVDGATVSFDNDVKGETANGVLSVQVYVTGTPYKTYTVFKNGYLSYTGTIDKYPGKGETVDLSATLSAVPGTTAAPATTTQPSPLPIWIVGVALVIAGLVVSGRRLPH